MRGRRKGGEDHDLQQDQNQSNQILLPRAKEHFFGNVVEKEGIEEKTTGKREEKSRKRKYHKSVQKNFSRGWSPKLGDWVWSTDRLDAKKPETPRNQKKRKKDTHFCLGKKDACQWGRRLERPAGQNDRI